MFVEKINPAISLTPELHELLVVAVFLVWRKYQVQEKHDDADGAHHEISERIRGQFQLKYYKTT